MGSEVQLERYMPGYSAVRELGEDVSSGAWNYYDRQFQGTAVGLYPEYDKDVLKQKMLEHDAVFRRQVSELHRLYRTQRDLMEEMKRSGLYNHSKPVSSNPVVYQQQESSRWRSSDFPASNSGCTSPSVLGAEHCSPNLSLPKGKAPKTDLFSAQDADDSDDCEIIECRPGKVRRKMFDLRLPADEYIDPDEAHHNGGVETPALAFHSSNGFRSVQPYLSANGFAGDLLNNTTEGSACGRSGFSNKGYGSRRGSNCMKDLNEPIQIEDDLPTLDFLNHRTSRNILDTESLALRTPPKTYSREASFNSRYGQSGKPLSVDRENNKAKLPHPLNLGPFDTNESSLSQCLRTENYQEPSCLLQGRNGTTSYGASFPVLPDQNKEMFWKNKMMMSSKSVKGGHGPQIHSISHPSDELVSHWPRPMTSWEKHGGNSSEKQPYCISSLGLSKSSQASNQPPKVFGEKLNINSGYAVDVPRLIDLDHGSSSGSKEESISYPSVNFKNLGSGRDGAAAPGCSGNLTSHKYSKGLNIDLNCAEEMDLNATATDDAVHETAVGQNLVASDRVGKSHHTTLLPWLKPKPKPKPFGSDTDPADFSQASSNPLVNKIDGRSSDDSSKKITRFPVLSQPLTAGSFRLSKGQKSEIKQNIRVIDTNLPCEAGTSTKAPAAEKTAGAKVTDFKNLFDLNSCVTEDEVSMDSGYSAVKNGRGFDLEAPAPVDIEEDMNVIHGGDQSVRHPSAVVQQMQEEPELERVAAEAMISFCSLKEDAISERAAAMETLKWFARVVSSGRPSGSDQKLIADAQPNEEPIMRTSSDEMDYFEHMTLKLTVMSAEDYFPKSAFLPVPNPEEEPASAFASARPRRGQARRGRPKRDFQRDILPGLASLSRHEVTEDIQAFDELMKAGGHAWQFGKRAAAAKNKPRRGRPRTVNVAPVPSSSPRQPPPSCTEDVNLTGWGKTTRRPRRQRCPAGFLQPVRII